MPLSESARRRAKWLLLEFDNGLSLAVHFGLTGQLFHDGPAGQGTCWGIRCRALDVSTLATQEHDIADTIHFDDG